MSNTRLVPALALDWFGDGVDDVDVRRLPPFTTLLVRTVNSLYRLVVTPGAEVYVQGGAYFPDPTSAHIDGASIGGSSVRIGRICVGLLVQIRSKDLCILTSPVCGITTWHPSSSVVH
jgi:hypothetical protein